MPKKFVLQARISNSADIERVISQIESSSDVLAKKLASYELPGVDSTSIRYISKNIYFHSNSDVDEIVRKKVMIPVVEVMARETKFSAMIYLINKSLKLVYGPQNNNPFSYVNLMDVLSQ